MRLIGVLMGYRENDPAAQSEIADFRGMLAKLGWTDGNLRIEIRWGAGDANNIKALSKELIDLRPDAILSHTSGPTRAPAQATQTIPIVFVTVADPTASALVPTFVRPTGNITGFAVDDAAQAGKWVELLKEVAPGTANVALLWNPATGPALERYMPFVQSAASSLSIKVSSAPVQQQSEIEPAVAALGRLPVAGLIVMANSFNTSNRDLIIELAARYQMPALYTNLFFAKAGGLICFGADYQKQFRQVAVYVDRILRGARTADLPVQMPTAFQLLINLKTAKALGLTVPGMMIARADEVIE